MKRAPSWQLQRIKDPQPRSKICSRILALHTPKMGNCFKNTAPISLRTRVAQGRDVAAAILHLEASFLVLKAYSVFARGYDSEFRVQSGV